MRLGIDPTVDVVFKRLFGTEENASILIHFLNALFGEDEGRRIVSVEFLTPIHDRDTEDDKLVIVDLRVRDQSGRQIIVEMQVVMPKAFEERILYYWAKDYVHRLGTGEDYSKLLPTTMVCIVMGRLNRQTHGYCNRFRIIADSGGVVFSEHLEIHTLELGKFDQPVENLSDSRERWSYFLKNAEELDAGQLPETLDEPEIRKAVKVLSMISQSERDRVEYELREKRRRDQINREQLIHEGGIDIGREEGREEGERKGIIMGRIQVIQEILNEPVTPREELRQCSIEQLQSLLDDCQRRLRERSSP